METNNCGTYTVTNNYDTSVIQFKYNYLGFMYN